MRRGTGWLAREGNAKEADAKSGVALVADTVVGALDEVAGCVNYISHNQDKAKKRVDHLEEGVDIAVRNAEKSLTDCRNRCKFLNIDSLSHRLVVGLLIKAIQTL